MVSVSDTRRIAIMPKVDTITFVNLAHQETMMTGSKKKNAPAMLYSCGPCGKGYTSSKAYSQHLKSRAHTTRTTSSQDDFEFGTAESLPFGAVKHDFDDEESIEEIDHKHMKINGSVVVSSSEEEDLDDNDEEDDEVVVDPCCCFMCDKKHKSVERCMVHMHKHHGLFIPDIEYLKDPQGLFTYLGEKVKREYTCLYCNINCQPFESLEAVRMHMVAKSHCRVHYGDATDEQQEPELDEFYDYSTSYIDEDGNKQLVSTEGMSNNITLGCGGSELVITRETDEGGVSTKAIGSREYLRYYRQKPRPSQESVPVTSLKAAKHRSISLSTLQLKEKMERMKLMNQVMKQMKRSGLETMRCKMNIRSNPIRNFRPMNAIH